MPSGGDVPPSPVPAPVPQVAPDPCTPKTPRAGGQASRGRRFAVLQAGAIALLVAQPWLPRALQGARGTGRGGGQSWSWGALEPPSGCQPPASLPTQLRSPLPTASPLATVRRAVPATHGAREGSISGAGLARSRGIPGDTDTEVPTAPSGHARSLVGEPGGAAEGAGGTHQLSQSPGAPLPLGLGDLGTPLPRRGGPSHPASSCRRSRDQRRFGTTAGTIPSLGLPGSPHCPPGQSRATSRCQNPPARAGLGTHPPCWQRRDSHLCPQGGTCPLPVGTAPIRHPGQGTQAGAGGGCGSGQGAERAAAVPDPRGQREGVPAPQPPASLPGTYLMVFFSLRPRLESGVPTVSREVLYRLPCGEGRGGGGSGSGRETPTAPQSITPQDGDGSCTPISWGV